MIGNSGGGDRGIEKWIAYARALQISGLRRARDGNTTNSTVYSTDSLRIHVSSPCALSPE